MEGGVAFVGEVGVLKVFGVVFDDAFEEYKVIEDDGAAETCGYFDPRWGLSFYSWWTCPAYLDLHAPFLRRHQILLIRHEH